MVRPTLEVEEKVDRLVECLRDLVLQNNSDGEFATLGITPRVFVKSFEQRIHYFMEEQANDENPAEQSEIHIDYAFRNKGPYTEGQLRLHLRIGSAVYPAVNLLTFSGKIASAPIFRELLPKVKKALDEFFPVVVVHSSSDVEKGVVLDGTGNIPAEHPLMGRHVKPTGCGGELGAALIAFKQRGYPKKAKQRTSIPVATAIRVEAVPKKQLPSATLVTNKGFPSGRSWSFIRILALMGAAAFYVWYIKPSSV
jgi:hypothetical protein